MHSRAGRPQECMAKREYRKSSSSTASYGTTIRMLDDFGFLQITIFAQDISDFEKPPVFPECENQDVNTLKNCFYNELSQFVFTNFL